MRIVILSLIMMLLVSCSNPVKESLLGIVSVTVVDQPTKVDSVRVDIIGKSGKNISTEMLRNLSAETTLVFNDIPHDTGYSLVVKSFCNGRVKFTGSKSFAVEASDETHLSIELIPVSDFASDCWNSAISCDTVNGNYVLRWNKFEDSVYFATAGLNYVIVMDTNAIPDEPDYNTRLRLTTLRIENEFQFTSLEQPIGNESKAYFRMFLYSRTHKYYMKDCRTLYVQVRSGI